MSVTQETILTKDNDGKVTIYTLDDGRQVRRYLSYHTGRIAYSMDGRRLSKAAAQELLSDDTPKAPEHSTPDTPAYQVTTWAQADAMAKLLEDVAVTSRQVIQVTGVVQKRLTEGLEAITDGLPALPLDSTCLHALAEYMARRDAAIQAATFMYSGSIHLRSAATGSPSGVNLYRSWARQHLGEEL